MPIITPTRPPVSEPEKWLFNGWELTRKNAMGWAHRDGTNETAAFVGANTPVPGRAGELWRPKVQGPGRFAIDLWLQGATRAEVHDNWRIILRAMRRRNRLITVDRLLPNGEQIRCQAEVVGTIAPQHLSQRVWRASVTFNIPEGVWYTQQAYYAESARSSEASFNGRRIELTDFEPSTEVNDRLTVIFTGPGTTWYAYDWTDAVVGDWIRYNGTIPANCSLQLNCRTWQVGAAGNWTPDLGALLYSGARFLSVTPAQPGDVSVVNVSVGSGANSSTFCQINGPRVYAC